MCLAKRAKRVLGVVQKAAENVTEKPAYPVPNQEAPCSECHVPFWVPRYGCHSGHGPIRDWGQFGTGAGRERWPVRANREKTTAFQT